MQQGSILLNVLSTTFEDLTLVVPTFKVATVNKDLRGILHGEDLASLDFLALLRQHFQHYCFQVCPL